MMLRNFAPDLLPPQLAFLSKDVILFVAPAGTDVLVDKIGLQPPYGTVTVDGLSGRHRIAAMRMPSGQNALPSPAIMTEPSELAEELDAVSCRRFLGFLLGFCRTAYRLGADHGFAAACLRVARLCGSESGAARPVAMATSARMLVSGVYAQPGAALYVLGARGVQHVPLAASADRTGLQLLGPVEAGDLVLALGDDTPFWTVQPAAARLPDVFQPGTISAGTIGAWRNACLRALAPTGGTVAALVRETQFLSPAPARRHDDPSSPIGAALDLMLSDGAGGLFLRGWLRDPLDLIVDASIATPFATVPIEAKRLHRVRRPDLKVRYAKAPFRDGNLRPGFVAHVRDPSGGLCPQPILTLRLRSGNTVEVTAPLRHWPASAARDAVLASVTADDVTPAMLDDCLIPAAAALHRHAMSGGTGAGRGSVDVVQFGSAPRAPSVSIIIPLYNNLHFLRFQAAAFAADAECRRAELIYVLDSPEQRAEVEHLLRGLHLLHELAFTLAVMPQNLGYAAANNAAASLAKSSVLLLLNSDVVPTGPGWLEPLRGALASTGVGAVGPKLLFDDGSIQHAGLFFARDASGTWFNAHYHKGMPRHWPAALRRRRVPGVTGAALMVRRSSFEAVGGVCEDYIIGDYEDSDLCLRLREAGAAIAYVPEAELFHFERRSIRLHIGYVKTLASLYNRRLHHDRWDTAMTALMALPAYRVTT